eukprot:jgi/Tetstr1/456609/TSEL_043312.t1
MRRLSVITVEHESAGSSSGSVSDAWRSECGRDEDTWEVFQAHKGVIPTLSQVQSSAAVLVLGSAGAAATLRDEYRRALLELLLKMAALQLLPIFAAGNKSFQGGESPLPGELSQEGSLVEAMHPTSSFGNFAWTSKLEPLACSHARNNCAGYRMCALHRVPSQATVLTALVPASSAEVQPGEVVSWHIHPNVLGVNVHPEQDTSRMDGFLLSLNQPSFRLESYRTGVWPAVSEEVAAGLPKVISQSTRAVMAEYQRQTLSAQLVRDTSSVVEGHYHRMEGQAKGLRAFLQCLQVKKELQLPTLRHVEQIEEHVSRLEALVAQLDENSLRLERMCCSPRGDPETGDT